jgi:AraC-like DNA-binding protein
VGKARGASKSTAESARHWLASALALQLVRVVSRWQVSPSELLEGLGVSEAELSEPGAMLPLDTVIALWDRARALTQEPGLGFTLGLNQHTNVMGYAGFAAMSAESYGQALELIRYTRMISTMFSLRVEVQGEVASLIVEEHSDPKSVRDMLLIGLLVSLRQIGEEITGGRLKASIDLTIPEPDYYRRFAPVVPDVRFGQRVSRLCFPASSLALPLVMADPVAMRLAEDQCERAMQDLGAGATLVAGVRRALSGREGFRSLRRVAAELRVSPRTLMKILADEGTSFTSLVDDERRQRAQRLLSIPNVTLEDVAGRLGYSSLSNFVRAFHRWTGQTPAAFRRGTRMLGTPAIQGVPASRTHVGRSDCVVNTNK